MVLKHHQARLRVSSAWARWGNVPTVPPIWTPGSYTTQPAHLLGLRSKFSRWGSSRTEGKIRGEKGMGKEKEGKGKEERRGKERERGEGKEQVIQNGQRQSVYRCTRENGRWEHKKNGVPLVSSARVVTVTGQAECWTETGQQCHPVCSRHHSIPAGREKVWVSQWCVLHTCNATNSKYRTGKEREEMNTPPHTMHIRSLCWSKLFCWFASLYLSKLVKVPAYRNVTTPNLLSPKPPYLFTHLTLLGSSFNPLVIYHLQNTWALHE